MSNEKKGLTICFKLGAVPATIFIVFLLLKVFGYVNWGWWLVTLPLWGSPLLLIMGLLFWVIVSIWFSKRRY